MTQKFPSSDRRTFSKPEASPPRPSSPKAPSPKHRAPSHRCRLMPTRRTTMPTRNLGKTGYKVGIFSLGGQAALEKSQQLRHRRPHHRARPRPSASTTSTPPPSYGGPERWSEQYVGRVMKTRRNDAFLATKTKERTRGRLHAHDREVASTPQHRPRRSLAAPRRRSPEDVDAIFAKGGQPWKPSSRCTTQKVVRLPRRHRPLPPPKPLIDTVNRYNFDTILMAMNRRRHPHPQLSPRSPKLLPTRRRKADGHHRHEGPLTRPPPRIMDAAVARRATPLMGGLRHRPPPRRHDHEGRDALHTHPNP